jgi:hypothetical protein
LPSRHAIPALKASSAIAAICAAMLVRWVGSCCCVASKFVWRAARRPYSFCSSLFGSCSGEECGRTERGGLLAPAAPGFAEGAAPGENKTLGGSAAIASLAPCLGSLRLLRVLFATDPVSSVLNVRLLCNYCTMEEECARSTYYLVSWECHSGGCHPKLHFLSLMSIL